MSKSDRRPDILIYNHPSAFIEGDAPYQSVIIIEIKRPERKEYPDDENPYLQMFDYIELLKAGKIEDGTGEIPWLEDNTRFYCYLIASLTPKIRRFAKAFCHPTPDNMGYFGYASEHKAYVETIDYKKLYKDSKQRNRVLFDKLGLSH